ncbi:MAG: bifunctional 5,10-methylenetetrahydrofolate dehydrogenase/5,10-methenyltetrahydrofolate cyclohydrolase [Patescibacteria group bacterium]
MIINGKALAQRFTMRLQRDTRALLQKGVRPGFGILLVGDDPASHLYVSMKLDLARKLGFYCKRVFLPKNTSEEIVVQKLKTLQNNPRIHGVIVQIPLPKPISLGAVCATLDPKKDIDCLHPSNLKSLQRGVRPVFWPPTAESVVSLIKSTKQSLKNKKVVIVGCGFFAHQIAALCASKGARVKVVSSSATRIKQSTLQADIVISAVGKPKIITGDSIKKGAIVIDVGASKQGNKTVGDVDMESVAPKAKAVSPVPGGVGPVTVVILMKNVLDAAKRLTRKQ